MILKKGHKNDDVAELQKALNALRFNCGIADGIFGPATEHQVELFQESVKIHADGIVGRNTLKNINYYLSNSISRASKTMNECSQIREKQLLEKD